MNGIFDSHAHYDDERFDADRDELLESIHREGVEYIMTIGADLTTSYAARELAERYDFVYFAAGIHPEQAGDAPENYLEELKALAAHPKCRAIGEIGLDYYWAENPPKERQMELFRQQVLLAKELGLPVIIHDREAHADTLALLRELHPAGVLHCFSGSVEMAKEVAALGMYLGFTGAITFKNARKAPQAAAVVPDDRLLIETDCPYMAPEPYRGKRCDSSMLPRVAERLAEALGDTDSLGSLRYNIAATQLELGQPEKALLYFSALPHPRLLDLHKLAICHEQLGHREQALTAVQQAELLSSGEIERQMLALVRYRLEHPGYLHDSTYGAQLLDCFQHLRDTYPMGFTRFHLPWVLAWYKANRQYRQACRLLEEFPVK